MTRDEFQPATILNLLAASWIQFMVHDWFVHKRSTTERIDIPTAAGRRLGRAEHPGAALGARPGAGRLDAAAGLRQPEQPLVGRVADLRLRRRRWPRSCARSIGGKLRIEPTGLLPVDPETGVHFAGFTDNWWIGLAMLHTLFTLEHNYICDLLAHAAPGLERRAALSQGQADQLGADGQDPHRRVDAGDPAAPDHQDWR